MAGRCRAVVPRAAAIPGLVRRQVHQQVPASHSPRPSADPVFSTPPPKEPTAAYVHLPFCKRKCRYCDFPVVALGRQVGGPTDGGAARAASLPVMTEYIEAILSEIHVTPCQNTTPLRSVYFGGGTPSLVPPADLARVLELLRSSFGIAADAEISLEADPGTFDVSRLRDYAAAGINRVSLGVQAFQDDMLKLCGRSHTVADVMAAIQAIWHAGLETWSLDLISGLPHLTKAAWKESLTAAIEAKPPHISVYDLQVETGTPFARLYSPGEHPLPSDGLAATLLREAHAVLTAAGYEHYEVSSYARPGRRGRHNCAYWAGGPFYGFGMGAASYLQSHRFTRPKKLKGYLSWAAALPDSWPVAESPETSRDRLLDAIMLRCRLTDGVDMGVLRHIAGDSRHEPALLGALAHHVEAGLAWREPAEDNNQSISRFGLTVPDGFLLSNHVISDLFAALDDE